MSEPKRKIANAVANALTAVLKGEAGATTLLQGALDKYNENAGKFSRDDEAPSKVDEAEESNEKKDEKHVDRRAPARFIYGGNVYVSNGARYIAKTPARNQKYSSVTDPKKNERVRALMTRAASFPSGPVFNFNKSLPFDGAKKANQWYPYKFQGHHMIPREIYDDHGLWQNVLELRAGADYDINNGANVIMLPRAADHVDVHGLPCHFSNHANYSRQVREAITVVVDEMKELLAKKEPHPHYNSGTLAKRLADVQDTAWDLICEIGQGLQRQGFESTAGRTPLVDAQTGRLT